METFPTTEDFKATSGEPIPGTAGPKYLSARLACSDAAGHAQTFTLDPL